MQVRRLIAWTVVPAGRHRSASSACNSGDSAKVDPTGVVSIQIAEPQHLLPTNTNDASGVQVLAALFAPLVDYDAEQQAGRGRRRVDRRPTTTRSGRSSSRTATRSTTARRSPSDNYIDAWNYAAYGPNGQDNGYFFEPDRRATPTLSRPDPDGEGPEKAPTPKAKTMTGLKKVDDLTFTVTLAAAVHRVQDRARLHRVLPAAEGRFLLARRDQRRTSRTRRSATARSR